MSVQRRGEKWTVKVYDPIRKEAKWIGSFDSKKEADDAEAKARLDRKSGGGTIESYAERWLELHPRQRESTMMHYRERLGVFVKRFGPRQLADINRVQAREWVLENRSAHGPVRAMYADAIRDGLISENPFANMRLQQSRGRRDIDVLSEQEVQRAISVAGEKFGPSFAAFVATAAYVGMRPGELYALQWDAIDFEQDEIQVLSSYSTLSGHTTHPKTHQQRVVVMFPQARQALLQLPRESRYVFLTIKGKRLTGRTLHYYWDPIRTAISRPGMAFYELRHFCAAHLLNTLGHEAEDVAYQLGHTDGGVLIRKLYGHPSEQLARERLKQRFGRKVVPIRPITGAEREQMG